MDRNDIENAKRLASEIKTIQRRLEGDAQLLIEKVGELKNLFIERSYENSLVESAMRSSRSVFRSLKDIHVHAQIGRVIPDLEREVNDTRKKEKEVRKNIVEVDTFLASVRKK